MPRKTYSSWYSWSDLSVLETVLRAYHGSDPLVVEVATGPNIAVPHVLKKSASSFRYVSLDLEKTCIQLQRNGVGNMNVEAVVGDAVNLPFRHKCVDIFIFHHAIDDILETRGLEGLRASIENALRTLKIGGTIIFSHSVFDYDQYTLKIDLFKVQALLRNRVEGYFKKIDGPRQKWLIVEDVHIPV